MPQTYEPIAGHSFGQADSLHHSQCQRISILPRRSFFIFPMEEAATLWSATLTLHYPDRRIYYFCDRMTTGYTAPNPPSPAILPLQTHHEGKRLGSRKTGGKQMETTLPGRDMTRRLERRHFRHYSAPPRRCKRAASQSFIPIYGLS